MGYILFAGLTAVGFSNNQLGRRRSASIALALGISCASTSADSSAWVPDSCVDLLQSVKAKLMQVAWYFSVRSRERERGREREREKREEETEREKRR